MLRQADTLNKPIEKEPVTQATAAIIVVFLLAYLVPGNINLGSLTMGFPRLILTITMIPATVVLLTDPRYKLTIIDALVACYAFWVFVSILFNNGFGRLEFAGLQVVETFGAYALGRIMFRNPQAYRLFWRVFAYCMLFILPFGLVELLTNQFLLHQIFNPIISTFGSATIGYPTRMGFDRVQGNLEHPILFGVFWGFGMLHFLSVFEARGIQIFFMGVCSVLVAISLSSGAYLAIVIQLSLLAWGVLTKERWKLLLIFGAILYLLIEILSDRPAIVAISTRLAFSADTAYWRVLIFEYGVQNVWANPVFGLGLRDWVRPEYLTPSIDNQWLLTAMRAGIPAFVFQMAAFGIMARMLIKRNDLPIQLRLYRRNFLISFVGLFIALGTVAVWSGTQAFLWLLLAMGTSMALAPTTGGDEAKTPETAPEGTGRGPNKGRHHGPLGPAYARRSVSASPSPALPYAKARAMLTPSAQNGAQEHFRDRKRLRK